ncbi:hypothetical protein F5146DRAFT_937576, partial [Armillaria mellea]
CCIPCLKSLLPLPHHESVLDLLYIASYWHALAKLCMHTEFSLKVLEQVHIALGNSICHFANVTCSAFQTVETDKEYAAQCQADNCHIAKVSGGNLPHTSTSTANLPGPGGKRPWQFSLVTSKLHALGDYPSQIRCYSTTDSYSTMIVCAFTFCW